MNELIAIVDDEPDILELVSIHLEKANYKIAKFDNSQEFLKFIEKKTPDLLILDLMLPDIDGIEVCKQLKSDKKTSNFPIIMLTAKGDEFDKVLGLELGADDYITKPFSTRELVARVRAVLRRYRMKTAESTININNDLVIDLQRYSVTVNGHPVNLTSTEFNILKVLATKRGWVFSREQLLQHLWGDDKIVISRTIDVHIKHLREKLGSAAHYIKNIRGVGYKLE
ncbi:response regulator transcription factor [bacterium]|nr:response regulator transcription factor [bacterium]MBU1635093.1 response regulator transcription factor [bacterium]MBU1872717.1 response regulator transcription factor [bacterium]